MRSCAAIRPIAAGVEMSLVVATVLAGVGLHAASVAEPAPITVAADRPDAIYHQGETVRFLIRLAKNSPLPADATLAWNISKDGVPPIGEGKVKLSGGTAAVAGQLDEPGFLLCRITADVGGRPVSALAGAGVDPLAIKPSMPPPDDFEAFWAAGKRRLAAVPTNARLTPLTHKRVSGVECFAVQLDCVGAGVSGYFARPSNARPHCLPTILFLEGAGVNSAGYYSPMEWAQKGLLAMEINAHGIPNGQPPEFYDKLRRKMAGYPHFGQTSRDGCYFLGMFLRAVRAIDFLAAQPQWDGKTVVVFGSSQGGFQAFAAALDDRVSFIAAGVPADCDHTGRVAGRVNGWPKFLHDLPRDEPDDKSLQTARYFDNVNFAARTKAKAAFVTVGFIDTTCPPTTVYAAYNNLPIAKEIYNDIPTGHANSPRATAARTAAVMKYLESVKK